MLLKKYRLARKIAFFAAALPLLQATGGCDATATFLNIGYGFANILVNSLTQAAYSSFSQALLGTFPGSPIIRALFGGNAGFFPGFGAS
jgi:hypothetical protein